MTPGAWSFQGTASGGLDRSQVINRLAQRVNHAAQEGVANRNRKDLAGALNALAFGDAGEVAKDNDTNIAGIKVLGQAQSAVFEAKQLIGHDGGKTLHLGDAVTCRGYAADLGALSFARFVGRCELIQGIADVVGVDGQFGHLQSLLS